MWRRLKMMWVTLGRLASLDALVHCEVLTRWCRGKESACKCRRCKRWCFHPWVGKIPWRRKWQPTPVFMPGKSHGERDPTETGGLQPMESHESWIRLSTTTMKSTLCSHLWMLLKIRYYTFKFSTKCYKLFVWFYLIQFNFANWHLLSPYCVPSLGWDNLREQNRQYSHSHWGRLRNAHQKSWHHGPRNCEYVTFCGKGSLLVGLS